MTVVGRGTVACEGSVTGKLERVVTVDRVLELMGADLSETILWTEHASVTAIVPILPHVRGVVCEGGGVTSHLAIVSRQLGVPCIVAADIQLPAAELDGRTVSIGPDGQVLAVA